MNKILVFLPLLFAMSSAYSADSTIEYEKFFLVINTDNTLVLKQEIDKDFINTLVVRLNEFTSQEIESKGSLKQAAECAPHTIKIVQDVESLDISKQFKAGFWTISGKRNDAVQMSIGLSIYDCENNNKIFSLSLNGKGKDSITTVKTVAAKTARLTYKAYKATSHQDSNK